VRLSTLPIDCDRTLAASARAHDKAPAHPNLVLCTSILASSLAFIDGSVVNVGLSAIGRDFAGGGADLSWVVNGYLLPLSSLLLLGGALGGLLLDHFSITATFTGGMLLLVLSAVIVGRGGRIWWTASRG